MLDVVFITAGYRFSTKNVLKNIYFLSFEQYRGQGSKLSNLYALIQERMHYERSSNSSQIF